MKFVRTLISRGTVKKQKEYEFILDEKDIEEGMKRDYLHPHFVMEKQDNIWFGLSNNKGKLRAVMYHSYDVFILKEEK